LKNTVISFLFTIILTSCSETEINSFEVLCEKIEQSKLEYNNAEIWTGNSSILFDPTQIKKSYVQFFNKAYLERIENRAKTMAWKEDNAFHIVNLSAFLYVEPEEIIKEWENGVALARASAHQDPYSACLYATLTNMFDSVSIHTMETDPLGVKWTEDVRVIRF